VKTESIDRAEIRARAARAREHCAELAKRPVGFDMTRGKPCSEQLDLSRDLMLALGPDDYRAADGTDCRNYGALDGLPETKALLAPLLDAPPSAVLVGGNSSLHLMHDTVARALSHGVPGGSGPWSAQQPKFLCPSPGYDRHFGICEHFGVEMLPVAMTQAGVDIDEIGRLVASDASVKAIWLVPKYSNPTGITLARETVEALARLRCAAPDFRILWDNAYGVHDLYDESEELANVLEVCRAAGCPDRPIVFASTSKISLAGAGLAAVAASDANRDWLLRHWQKSTIGHDKLNQLRHMRFFKSFDGVRAHMRRHAAILRPKFEAVERVLAARLGGTGVAQWTKPRGGYFVSLDTLDGCARDVVKRAGALGVKLTPAGATFPYGKDPRDRNIRLAPSFPSLPEIEQALDVVASCVLAVSAERL
jgi:DNA-binding transcriptional MocR family regulator